MKDFNLYFDHTLLKPEAIKADIIRLCNEAKEYRFYAVCVNSSYVPLAVSELQNTGIKVAAVVGFPLGACSTEAKAFETTWACMQGAQEIDMVISVGALKDKDYDYVREDIAAVVEAAKEYSAITKVILETCLLSEEEIIKACQLSKEAGADFVKTSTGFNKKGATSHDIALMKKTVGDSMRVKASGGIRDYSKAVEMIEAGADRIGASASVHIVRESRQNSSQK
ncbi:MAG: deoxyribose-phosphate aldolase [Anaerovoracaceae bacterium]|jgi:deoxyribose-phosphate aldolase